MNASVEEEELNNALKRAVFVQAISPWCVSTVTMLLCTWFLYGQVSLTALIWWASASLFVSILRLPVLLKAQRLADTDLPIKLYTVLTGISGLLWGSLALFLSDQHSMSDQLVILMVPLLLSLGGSVSFSPWRPTYRTFVLSTQIPLILILLFVADAGFFRVIPPLLFFLCASLFMGERFFLQHKETQSLRLRNLRLVDDLSLQNDSLIVARDDAQEACKVKDEFLARMSHELRTPMNGVLGASQLLSKTSLNPQQDQLMTTLQISGEGMLVLIDNLLDASSLATGEIDLDNRPYSIAQVLEVIEVQSAARASQKKLRMNIEIDSDVPHGLIGDERRIMQVVTGLIDNAIKFTPHGSVSIQISRIRCVDQVPDNHDLAEQLQIVVTDTGVGIAESELHRVSELFYQSDGEANRRYGGSGLGLSIARSLVDLMGGTLAISSEVDKGTCVTVSVPLIVDPALDAGESAQVVAATSAGVRTRVLVVEDNPINQLVIEAMLEDLTCKVTVAENGLEALAELENNEFDIVFMDCQMPELDGYGATIQAREKGYQLPIVAVTANAMAGDRQKCLSVGMDDYVSKPFTADTITRMLEKWTGKGELKLAV